MSIPHRSPPCFGHGIKRWRYPQGGAHPQLFLLFRNPIHQSIFIIYFFYLFSYFYFYLFCLFMYVCMYACMHVFIYIFVYLYVIIHMHIYLYVYLCLCIINPFFDVTEIICTNMVILNAGTSLLDASWGTSKIPWSTKTPIQTFQLSNPS